MQQALQNRNAKPKWQPISFVKSYVHLQKQVHIFLYSCYDDYAMIRKTTKRGGSMGFFRKKETPEQLLERLRKRAAACEADYNREPNCRNLRNYTHAKVELEQLEEELGLREHAKQE